MATKLGFQLESSLASKHLTDAEYIKGGYITVSTTAERDALPKASSGDGVIVAGSLVYVTANNKTYRYNGTTWDEEPFIPMSYLNPNNDGNTKVAALDSNGKVPLSQIPDAISGSFIFGGYMYLAGEPDQYGTYERTAAYFKLTAEASTLIGPQRGVPNTSDYSITVNTVTIIGNGTPSNTIRLIDYQSLLNGIKDNPLAKGLCFAVSANNKKYKYSPISNPIILYESNLLITEGVWNHGGEYIAFYPRLSCGDEAVHKGSSNTPIDENIYGVKSFFSSPIFNKHIKIYGDEETTTSDSLKPANTIGDLYDPDALYYNTGITIYEGRDDDQEQYSYKLIFPAGNGTLALRSDANLIETTWSALKTLRDSSGLIPGKFYRITDYRCTTTQQNTSSAAHDFDIIVLALATNKLSEEAFAAQHAGAPYFSNCDLSAWKLWYCLDNDTSRFAWADITNGKGVIYRMIDEFDNDVPYDFKNILFPVYLQATSILVYTFSYTENNTTKDASLLGLSKACYSNIMKEYINSNDSNKQDLNFNVFYSAETSFTCHSNTFGRDCRSNTFRNSCYNNTFGNKCTYNKFESGCHDNIFGTNCFQNTFESNCSNNLFNKYFQYNTFGTSCSNNTFKSSCVNIVLGTHCSFNTFGCNCYYISTPTYCKHIIIDNGCCYLYLSSTDTSASDSNYLQNVHIHLGVKGTSASSRKTITIPDRNLSYETDVYPVGSTEMFI